MQCSIEQTANTEQTANSPPPPSNSPNGNPQGFYEDEIDLVEIAAVLWRQRWFILGVTALVLGLAFTYCLVTTPQYEISAQFRPGITGFDETGKPVHHRTTNDIETWFTKGGYRDALTKLLGDDELVPKVSVDTGRQTQTATLRFNWPEPEKGKQLLQSLIELLSTEGSESVQKQLAISRNLIEQEIDKTEKDKEHISIERERLEDELQTTQQKLAVDKRALEQEIHATEKELEHIPIERVRLDNQIARIKNKLKVITAETESIKGNRAQSRELSLRIREKIDNVSGNTEEIMQLRQKMVAGDSDKFALLMYSNIVQQNISYITNLQQQETNLAKEINDLMVQEATKLKEKDDLLIEIQELEIKRDQELQMKEAKLRKNLMTLQSRLEQTVSNANIRLQDLKIKRNQELTVKSNRLQKNIEVLKIKLDGLTPVTIVQPPFSSNKPVKPAKIKILALAGVCGAFLAIFAAFLREFWIKNKGQLIAAEVPKPAQQGKN